MPPYFCASECGLPATANPPGAPPDPTIGPLLRGRRRLPRMRLTTVFRIRQVGIQRFDISRTQTCKCGHLAFARFHGLFEVIQVNFENKSVNAGAIAEPWRLAP